MNVNGINFESIVDGMGVRVVTYISGCTHNCAGCHNPKTHDFDSGKLFTLELQQQIIDYIKKTPFIKGITFSGGDPMSSPIDVLNYIYMIKSEIPDINIWLYTGFLYDDILLDKDKLNILKEINVLVDGKFKLPLKDTTLVFKGSTNQRIINVQDSLIKNKVILWRN